MSTFSFDHLFYFYLLQPYKASNHLRVGVTRITCIVPCRGRRTLFLNAIRHLRGGDTNKGTMSGVKSCTDQEHNMYRASWLEILFLAAGM